MHQGPRAQIDRKLYKKHMQDTLFHYPNLEARAGSVFDLVFNKPLSEMSSAHGTNPHELPRISGVQLGVCFLSHLSMTPFTQKLCVTQILGSSLGVRRLLFALALFSRARFTLVRTYVTRVLFSVLNRSSTSGMKRFPAGRMSEAPSVGLSASLRRAGFKLGRLQTGTPARLDANTIDFSELPKAVGDAKPRPFSFSNLEVDNAVRYLFIFVSWGLRA